MELFFTLCLVLLCDRSRINLSVFVGMFFSNRENSFWRLLNSIEVLIIWVWKPTPELPILEALSSWILSYDWYCYTMHIILWFNNIIIFFSISTVYHIIFVNLQHYYKYLCACQLDSWKPLTQICDDLCLSGIWICGSQYPQVFPWIKLQVLTGLGYSCPPLVE